jgi:Leucine-rich repeat (LRR) protein
VGGIYLIDWLYLYCGTCRKVAFPEGFMMVSGIVMLYLMFLVCAAPILLIKASCIGNISQIEYDALQAFYEATHGASWHVRDHRPDTTVWSFPSTVSTPCGTLTWEGLTCNETDAINTVVVPGVECAITRMWMINYNLQGSLPSLLGSMTSLQSVDFNSNCLSGTLPEALGNLTNLYQLSMYYNLLSSTIPVVIFKLPSLQYTSLQYNYFTGPYPSYASDATNALQIFLNDNLFTNPLPGNIGTLKSLLSLGANTNFLTGTLAPTLGEASDLTTLYLFDNYFTGEFPSQMGQLGHLETCLVYYNFLSSSLPSELGQLTVLVQFGMENNLLTGQIPSELGNMSKVQQFVLHSNSLSGTIPSELSRLQELSAIELSGNSLTGDFPVEMFWNNTHLLYLLVNDNYLQGNLSEAVSGLLSCLALEFSGNYMTGSIPDALYQLSLLNEFIMSENLMSSTVSASIHSMKQLEIFNVSNNFMTSVVPSEFGDIIFMRTLSISQNYISGPIPTSIAKCLFIQAIDVGGNMMTSTIPTGFGRLDRLLSFNASNNYFSGYLDDTVFTNQSVMNALEYFDVSSNTLSGPIPPILFQLSFKRPLRAVVMHSNCFIGTLPPEICDATNLTVLILDSASSADGCDVALSPILREVFKVQIGRHHLQGSIPECVWSMPTLTTLHLSGNGLGGTLGQLPDAGSLNDVSLASNAIVGSIPHSWQVWPWSNLDLSGNKLSGALEKDFVVTMNTTAIDLTVNRLSGNIPDSLRNAFGVNILNGNLFACGAGTKPVHDPDSAEYVCGSDDFNDSMIVWILLIGVAVALCVWKTNNLFAYANKLQHDIFADIVMLGFPDRWLDQFIEALRRIVVASAGTTLGFVLISMMTYIVMKSAPTDTARIFTTHSFQYLWQTTAAFLHSSVPTILILLYLYAAVGCVGVVINVSNEAYLKQRNNFLASLVHLNVSWTRAARIILLFIAHLTVTILVNVLYVYVLLRGVSGTDLLFLQLALSVFKLLWNNVFVTRYISKLHMERVPALFCSTFLVLFTFVAGPVIATFLSDTSCFLYVITGQPPVDSTFAVDPFVCALFCDPACHVICRFSSSPLTIFTSVTPSWSYSYQCSSVLLVNYTPVFVFSYAISGIVMPIVMIAYLNAPAERLEASLFKVFNLAKLTRDTLWTHSHPDSSHTQGQPNPIHDACSEQITEPSGEAPTIRRRLAFNSNSLLSKLLMNIGVLLTFGLASPLLAIAVFVDTLTVVIMWFFMVRRFVNLHAGSERGVDNSRAAWERLEYCTENAVTGIHSVVWVIVGFVSVFWSLFVFDMIGDVFGGEAGGFMVMCPTLGLYVLLWIVGICNDRYMDDDNSSRPTVSGLKRSTIVDGVELIANDNFVEATSESTA